MLLPSMEELRFDGILRIRPDVRRQSSAVFGADATILIPVREVRGQMPYGYLRVCYSANDLVEFIK